jgi:hypothetical protein
MPIETYEYNPPPGTLLAVHGAAIGQRFSVRRKPTPAEILGYVNSAVQSGALPAPPRAITEGEAVNLYAHWHELRAGRSTAPFELGGMQCMFEAPPSPASAQMVVQPARSAATAASPKPSKPSTRPSPMPAKSSKPKPNPLSGLSPAQLRAEGMRVLTMLDKDQREHEAAGRWNAARECTVQIATLRGLMDGVDVPPSTRPVAPVEDPRLAKMNAIVRHALGEDRKVVCKNVGAYQFAGVSEDFVPR